MSLKALIRHPFVTDNLWYGSSSILVNLLNYLYLLMALSYLSKETFGAFNALVAILTLTTVVANPLHLHVTKDVANLRTMSLPRYFFQGHLWILTAGGVGMLLLAAGSRQISTALNVAGGNLVLVCVVATGLLLATFANGIATGLKKLQFQAVVNLSASVVKFALGWMLFNAGLGVGAGLGGYLAGFVLSIAMTGWAARAWEPHRQGRPAVEAHRESLAVLVLGYLFVAVPFSMDQVLVQMLNHKLSGDYAALATLGKLVFFVGSPFQIVLYSYLVRARHERARLGRYFLVGTLGAVGAAAAFTAVLWIGGPTLVGTLLTPAYLGVSRWVPAYGLGICGYVFAYSVVLLGIVRNDPRMVGLVSIASFAQAGLFFARNATLDQLVANQVWCLAILCAGSVLYLAVAPPWSAPSTRCGTR